MDCSACPVLSERSALYFDFPQTRVMAHQPHGDSQMGILFLRVLDGRWVARPVRTMLVLADRVLS